MKKQEKVFMVVLGFLALILLAFPMTASARNTWYVSPTGNDTNAGTETSPWLTITYAVSQATAGDIIKVMDDDNESTDDYIENITVDKSLTIERYNDTGANPQVKASNSGDHVFNVTADNVTIRGLDIYGATDSEKAGIYLSGRTGCTIENNRCGWDTNHKNYYGIRLYSSSNNNIVSGNTCNSNNIGIWLYSSSDNTVSGNTCCSSNNGYGIWLYPSSNNNTVSDNTCNSNDRDGILLHSSSDNTVSGNTCNSNSWDGIVLGSSSNNNTVSGNTCNSNSWDGIVLGSSSNNTVSGNTCSSNHCGIDLHESSNNTLTNNTMVDDGIFIEGDQLEHWNTHSIDVSNTVNGKPVYYWKNQTGGTVPSGAGEVILANCTNVIVEGQDVSNGSVGIELGFSNGNTIANSTCSSNSYYGINLYESSNNAVSDNTCSSNGDYGILLVSSSNNNTVSGNTASNNDYGIWLSSSSNNNTISDNTADSNYWDGIVLSSSSNNTLTDNTCSSNGDKGIVLGSSSGNTVSGNTANLNNHGICLDLSSNNTLTGNTADSNYWDGIYLYHSSSNTVSGNTCSSNSYYSIRLITSSSNNISGNTASNNDYGIYLSSSSNNTLCLNNLSNNTEANAYVDGGSGNIWNSPTTIYYHYYTSGSFHKNSLGNHYSDYGGSDGNGDGIGDSPYSGSGMTDSYPLMTTSDNYSLQAWWLHSNSIMYRDDMTKSPGSITLTGSGSHIWIADQATLTDISFSGNDTWTGQIVFTPPPIGGHTFTVEMGSFDGSDFTAGGPDATITGDGSATVFTYETDTSAFTVTTGNYLALKITNNSSNDYNVRTGGAWSYCSSPDSSPDYIIHTEPIAGSNVTKLFKNYPNPVVSTTTIEYQLKGNVMEQDAIINIYNIRGQLIKTVEGKGGVAILDASDLGNGIYFYRLKTDTYDEIKKMIILR